MLIKLALRREDDGTPTGHPAPCYFLCPCGAKIPVYNRQGQRIWNALVTTCPCGERVHIDGYLVSARRTVRVIFADGDSLTTDINGTKQEIVNYYVGNQFNLGAETDNLQRAVSVEFIA